MIRKILSKANPDDIMYLLNAVAFDAKWEQKYEKSDTNPEIFTDVNGDRSYVDMMHSEEDAFYLEEDGTVGFIKPYLGGQYAFVAILPPEVTTPSEYLAALTAEKYIWMLTGQQYRVEAGLPRFSTEDTLDANRILKEMGLESAFDSEFADFSGLSEDPVNISDVMHKTYIEVDENGTRAASASGFMFFADEAEPPERVILDRPFIYLIVDTDGFIPLFAGCVNYID